MTSSAETLDSRVARIETNLEHTTTKSDLAQVEARLTQAVEALDSRVTRVEATLEHTATKSDLAQVETRLTQTIAELERRLIYWAIGTGIAVIGGVSAAVRLFA